MEPRITTIEIRCRNGNEMESIQPVTAGVYGFLAVHKGVPSLVDEHRTITQIRTGFAVAQGLHRSVAIAVAERIGSNPIWGFRTMAEFEQRREELYASYQAALKEATQPAAVPQRRAVKA